VGLNKREAKEFVDAWFEAIRQALERPVITSSCRVLAIFSCATRTSGLAATPRPARKFRFPRGAW
jgi:nucleoid DNA-binding protein